MRTKHCANVYAYSCSVSARANHLQLCGRWGTTTCTASNFHSTLSSEALISGGDLRHEQYLKSGNRHAAMLLRS
ncbi:hypothetical protein ACVWZR_001911 [Bradyrhizobium sp. i1.3.1]